MDLPLLCTQRGQKLKMEESLCLIFIHGDRYMCICDSHRNRLVRLSLYELRSVVCMRVGLSNILNEMVGEKKTDDKWNKKRARKMKTIIRIQSQTYRNNFTMCKIKAHHFNYIVLWIHFDSMEFFDSLSLSALIHFVCIVNALSSVLVAAYVQITITYIHIYSNIPSCISAAFGLRFSEIHSFAIFVHFV